MAKTILRRLPLAGFGIASVLVALEIGIRLILPPIQDRVFAADPLLRWFHVRGKTVHFVTPEFDNWVHINRLGLVDDDHAYSKQAGVFRILLLGDSYTESLQVPIPQTFHGLLEKSLNEGGRAARYEVINGGVSAYGTDQELLFYETEGRRYLPDLVLLMASRNDVQDNYKHGIFTLDGGILRQADADRFDLTVIRPVGEFLYDHTQTYRYYVLLDRAVTLDGFYLPREAYRTRLDVDLQRGWEITSALVARLAGEVSVDGARFAIVYVPERPQMGGAAWLADTGQSAIVGVDWDISGPNERYGAIAAAVGVPFLDPTEDLRDYFAATGTPLFFQNDIHWTAPGHARMAVAMQSFLLDRSLIN